MPCMNGMLESLMSEFAQRGGLVKTNCKRIHLLHLFSVCKKPKQQQQIKTTVNYQRIEKSLKFAITKFLYSHNTSVDVSVSTTDHWFFWIIATPVFSLHVPHPLVQSRLQRRSPIMPFTNFARGFIVFPDKLMLTSDTTLVYCERVCSVGQNRHVHTKEPYLKV